MRENGKLCRTHKASWAPKLTRMSSTGLQLGLRLWRLRLSQTLSEPPVPVST